MSKGQTCPFRREFTNLFCVHRLLDAGDKFSSGGKQEQGEEVSPASLTLPILWQYNARVAPHTSLNPWDEPWWYLKLNELFKQPFFAPE